MSRKQNDLKTRTRFSNAMDSKLYDELQKVSKETSIPFSKLLDKAVKLLLEEYK